MTKYLLLCTAFLLTACDLPQDPENTFESVHRQGLRVGWVSSPPWSDGDAGTPSGLEPEFIIRLANDLNIDIEWHSAPLSELMHRLSEYELDLVIAGLNKSAPWEKEIAYSLPYILSCQDKRTIEHVIAAPPGENRWLLKIDKFIQTQKPWLRKRAEKLAQENNFTLGEC